MIQTPTQPAFLPDSHASVVLRQAVLSARAAVAVQRRLPRGAAEVAARADLLRALEAYVDSLLRRRLPVPYAMRDELRLQRLVSLVAS